MKIIKAFLLLLSLSASSLGMAGTNLGSFSESLNSSGSFKRVSLNNDNYSCLEFVTENGNFNHLYSFTLTSDKGDGLVDEQLDYPSNINFCFEHLKLSSQVTGNSTGTKSDNDEISMINSVEPEQWVMMVVVFFLVGMQVIKAKKDVEPLALK